MTPGTIDVLLTEDDCDLSEAMVEVLQRGGYRTMAVFNGQEALDWLQTASPLPSLILLDLMMPVMDGWGFRKEQLKNSSFASIPVAVLSARGASNIDDGVQILTKPIQTQALLAFVARYCARSA